MGDVIKASFERRPEAEPEPEPEAPPDIRIWQCACGAFEFELYDTGDVRCVGCGEISRIARCYFEY